MGSSGRNERMSVGIYDTLYMIRFVVYGYVLSLFFLRRSHLLQHLSFEPFPGICDQILETQLLVIRWRIIRGSFEMLFSITKPEGSKYTESNRIINVEMNQP
jgi:hypothetical protein